MKSKKFSAVLLFTVGLSGVAIGCSGAVPLPIPATIVTVTTFDLGRAALAGYRTYSGLAAAMKKLDALGKAAVGDAKWRATSYSGRLTYGYKLGAGPAGYNNIPVNKGCDETFLDTVERDGGSVGGGGGGIGGIGGGGCDVTSGIIGFIVTTIPWQVCTDTGCTSGTYQELSAQFGQIGGC